MRSYVKDLLRPSYYFLKTRLQTQCFKSEVAPLPQHLNMAFALKCLAACPHCYFLQENIDTFKDKTMLDEKLFEEVMESPYTRSIVSMTCGGGEALLHPELFNFLKRAVSKGIKHIQVVTNGVSLQAEEIIDKIISQQLITYLHISLDAIDEENFKKAKGINRCDFNLLCKNIRRIVEAKSRENLRIGVSYVVGMHNIAKVKDMITFAAELGVHYCHVTTLHLTDQSHSNRAGNPLESFPAEYGDILKQTNYPIDIVLQPPPEKSYMRYFCTSLASHLSISPKGLLAPCCHIPWDAKYGYFQREDNPLNNEQIKRMRRSFMEAYVANNSELLPTACISCPRRLKGDYNFFRDIGKWLFMPVS